MALRVKAVKNEITVVSMWPGERRLVEHVFFLLFLQMCGQPIFRYVREIRHFDLVAAEDAVDRFEFPVEFGDEHAPFGDDSLAVFMKLFAENIQKRGVVTLSESLEQGVSLPEYGTILGQITQIRRRQLHLFEVEEVPSIGGTPFDQVQIFRCEHDDSEVADEIAELSFFNAVDRCPFPVFRENELIPIMRRLHFDDREIISVGDHFLFVCRTMRLRCRDDVYALENARLSASVRAVDIDERFRQTQIERLVISESSELDPFNPCR